MEKTTISRWDDSTTLDKMLRLERSIQRVIAHTPQLGRTIGVDAEGSEIIEHPLGGALHHTRECLVRCYASLGRQLHRDGQELERWLDD